MKSKGLGGQPVGRGDVQGRGPGAAGGKARCGGPLGPYVREAGPRPGEPGPVSEPGLVAELEAGSLRAAPWCVTLEEGPRPWPGLAAASLGGRGPLLSSTVSDHGALAPAALRTTRVWCEAPELAGR